MAPPQKRQASEPVTPEEIEVTPKMIDAGVYVLACMDRRVEENEEVVEDIYRAMVMARIGEDGSIPT